ncbi:MAG: autotransporter-associated N-terminal domain-containing protein, partial [Leptotrichiaceae bacterium]
MSGNLTQLEKALRKIAKHSKSIKYTKGLLFIFLMTGMMSFSAEVTVKDKEIEQTKVEINDTVKEVKDQFRIARIENEKLLRNANLDLIQLMEQGDQVIKSPWSSWQFGANYYYNSWNGVYKGRGDKAEKYPYEGLFTRSKDPFERYISTESEMYSLLSTSTDSTSASSNARRGLSSNYGIASTTPVVEPIIGFEVSASVTPRNVQKGAITLNAKSATLPNLPQAINFSPVTPNITAPAAPVVNPPSITAPATGNGDGQWINQSGSVAPLHQQNMSGGTMNVTANNTTFNLTTSGINMTGESGAHNLTPNGVQNLNWSNLSQYAAMKLVGGQEINIDNVTINYTGTGHTGYQRWLFHTDGHNSYGESTWVLNNGTSVNMNGSYLVLYTSQYHSGTGQNANIGFVNDGTITTAGNNNIGWIALNEGGNVNRQQYFHNRAGTINIGGTSDIFAYVMSNTGTNGGWSIINDGTLNLTGANQFGIIVSNAYSYDAAEILLNSPMKISGTGTTGVVFTGWMDLDGGGAFSRSTADNIITTLPSTTRASVINVDVSGSNNTGVYFGSTSTNPFNINNYAVNVSGNNNTGFYVSNGIVNLGTGTKNEINITSGSDNIGIFAAASGDALSTAANITINSDKSTGIFAKSSGAVTNSGAISATGASVKAIVADATAVNNTGAINVTGTASSSTDGAVGLAAMNNGASITHTGGGTINVDGSASIAAFAQNGGIVNITGGTLTTTGGAFNVFSNGTVNLANTTIDTGASSLAFMAGTGGRILFNNTTA